MHLDRRTALALIALTIAGCATRIGKVNVRPDDYYGRDVTFSGRVGDILVRSDAGRAEVFHLVADHGDRLIVVVPGGISERMGAPVRVAGQFTAAHTYAGRTFYDALVAHRVDRAESWWRPPFF
jgi:hypothetical protein